jgi:biotin carboxyl carrier protein
VAIFRESALAFSFREGMELPRSIRLLLIAFAFVVFGGTPAVSAVRASEPVVVDEASARALEDLPPVESFLSPVGDPADFSKPAPGEERGYCLTRGVQHRRDRHLGLDLSNSAGGGAVRAPADGVVLESRRYGAWGQLVVIVHQLTTGQRVLSLLAHLQPGSVLVHAGDRVTAGQPLARVGSSGRSTGPHLHFELRDLGDATPWRTLWERSPVLDPLRYLGRTLAAAFPPPASDGATEAPWLRSVEGRRSGKPEAALTRREFYTWVARATGSRVAHGAAWSRLHTRLASLGLADLPASASAARAPVGHGEAVRALSLLLASGRLRPNPKAPPATGDALAVRGLAAPDVTSLLEIGPGPGLGPDLPLTRADGALLLLAARERAEAPTRAR